MKLRDISMFKKMTIAFVIFILLPILGLLVATYGQWRGELRREMIAEQWLRIDKVAGAIGARIEHIEGVSSAIVSDSSLIYLLNRRYSGDRYAFEQYNAQAYYPISQALLGNASSIWRIRMFYENPTVPEGWGAFYNAERASDRAWYQRCKEEGEPYWLRVNGNAYFNHYDLGDTIEADCFVFLRPVKDYAGGFLGVLCIEVKDDSLLEPFAISMSGDGFLISQDMTSGFGGELPDRLIADEAAREILLGGNALADNPYRGDYLLYEEIAPISAYLGVLLDMDAYDLLSGPMTVNFAAIVIAIGAAMGVFYIVMRNMTRRINENLAIMTDAVQGDLSLRVPVRGDDEVDRIARHFNSLIEMVDDLVKESVRKETAQRDAQLNDLQYRINPHFFYNTLDILAGGMVLAGQFEIAEAVSDFGKMLRYNLRGGLTGTLAQETQYIAGYMKVQDLRYRHRIHLEVDLPEELREREIIKFILQPIVENSVLHGLRDERLHIFIGFSLNARGGLVIVIRDDGKGVDQEQLSRINENLRLPEDPAHERIGIGLGNIGERIRLYYGEGARITMRSEPGVCTEVTMILPMKGRGDSR